LSKFQIQTEARQRQGSTIKNGGRRYKFSGDPGKVEFRQGAEGLVQPVVDLDTGMRYRIKCFFDPSPARRQRSTLLVGLKLANAQKNFADSLGGAPFEMLTKIGPTTPFAVVMKEIQGESWDRIKEKARDEQVYPPAGLPGLRVRATWSYGLATAVKQMEAAGFIHADIAHGNIMVTSSGPLSGSMALVDFDAFVHPQHATLDTSCLGTAGYAAPEVNRADNTRLNVGTDRVGMAILIQEFLIYGDPELNDPEAFLKGYDQEHDLNNHSPVAHPLLERKYPELADLLKRTLSNADPVRRPPPTEWREALYNYAAPAPQPPTPILRQIRIEGYPIPKNELSLNFPDLSRILDLSSTNFRMHVTLERDALGVVYAVVGSGAKIRVRSNSVWSQVSGGNRVLLSPDIVLIEEGLPSGLIIRAVTEPVVRAAPSASRGASANGKP
jgi:serine/threonine protein kinase